MKPLKFTIVTPFYNNNEGTFIEDIYKSVIDQTYPNWEWIITDDFSTDGTKEEILKLQNDKIRYIEQKFKKELFFNPQTYATGDIVVQLDSDDQMLPKALEVYNHYFNTHEDVLFMSCGTNYFDKQGNYMNSQYIYHGDYKNCLDKKSAKDINNHKIEEMNFLKINGGWGNLQAWRNIDIDFNQYNYTHLMYMDKFRALNLEEKGKYLHLPRTLFRNTFRVGSASHRQLGSNENVDDGRHMQRIKIRRTKQIESYIKKYDEIFVECLPLYYSNLNLETERKKISYFSFDEFNKDLLKELYFDHDLVFNEKEADYCFFLIRCKEHIERVKEILKNIRCKNITIFSVDYDFKSLKKVGIKNSFEGEYIEYYGFEQINLRN